MAFLWCPLYLLAFQCLYWKDKGMWNCRICRQSADLLGMPCTGKNCNRMPGRLLQIGVSEAESRGLARTGLRGLTCLYLVLWLAYSLTGAGSFAAAARDPEVGPRPVLGAKEHSARSPWCSSSFF